MSVPQLEYKSLSGLRVDTLNFSNKPCIYVCTLELFWWSYFEGPYFHEEFCPHKRRANVDRYMYGIRIILPQCILRLKWGIHSFKLRCLLKTRTWKICRLNPREIR